MSLVQALLLPVFLHVLLTTWVGVHSVRARIKSVVGGETRLKDIALDNEAWPKRITQLGNNFDNQFQVPVVWYACLALLLVTGLADWIAVILSWAFLATRVAHTIVHTGSNHVPSRMKVYLAGFGTVFLMWTWFALRLYVIG